MNWWIIAGGLLAAVCTAGHAWAGRDMYFRPIRSRLTDAVQASVFAGMWHFITIAFALSSLMLLACGIAGRSGSAVWLVAAEFAGYGAIDLVLSLRLGSLATLFQWMLFAGVGLLAAIGAVLS